MWGQKYAANADYLVALIVYLGTTPKWWSRSPPRLAKDLSLSEPKVRDVLDRFPNLFRKSEYQKRDAPEHTYSLQARYAQIRAGKTRVPDSDSFDYENETIPDPVSTDVMEMLLRYVSEQVFHEREGNKNWIALGASIVAAIAAIAAAILSGINLA